VGLLLCNQVEEKYIIHRLSQLNWYLIASSLSPITSPSDVTKSAEALTSCMSPKLVTGSDGIFL
jgi:hypothetical protein